MNLTIALTMPSPPAGAATLPADAGMPEKSENSAVSGDFSALLAMIAFPMPQAAQQFAAAAEGEGEAAMAASTGKILPVAGGSALPVQNRADKAVGVQSPLVPQGAEQTQTPGEPSPAAAPAGTVQAKPLELTLVLAAGQDASPALAASDQPRRAVADMLDGKASTDHSPAQAIAAATASTMQARPAQPAAAVSADPETAPADKPAVAALAPAPAVQTAPAPALTPLAEAPRPVMDAPAPSVSQPAAPVRHDFEAIVDKLVEARDLARPGRADLQLAHREFGQVSVQFEMNGQSLKVALSSNDAAFAPSMQAALAERPVAAIGDAARMGGDAPRQDSAQPGTAQGASSGAVQADGQRGDQSARNTQTQARMQGVQGQNQQSETGDESARQPRGSRSGSLFA